jgi:hypothetical protein
MKLELWTRPSNYLGASWDGYYVFLSQTRDSDTLTRSNFECALEQVGGRNDYALVIPYEKHWACGWVETILIHKTNTRALDIAQQILDKLEDYPVLNEEHYSELDYAENPEQYQD